MRLIESSTHKIFHISYWHMVRILSLTSHDNNKHIIICITTRVSCIIMDMMWYDVIWRGSKNLASFIRAFRFCNISYFYFTFQRFKIHYVGSFAFPLAPETADLSMLVFFPKDIVYVILCKNLYPFFQITFFHNLSSVL